MAKFKTIRDLQLAGKRVLMRVDFNVPQDKATGAITNNQRIAAALPTIKYALEKGASVVLMSHLGRPDGQEIAKFSLKPVADELAKLLGKPVTFLDDCVGPAGRGRLRPRHAQARRRRPAREPPLPHRGGGQGQARGRHSKKAPIRPRSKAFRASLTKLGDVYVNDAFGTAHRAHSSMVGVSLPEKAAGFLMEAELNAFGAVLENPKRPLLAILGGAKIADKIPLINNLLEKANEHHHRRRHGLHLQEGARGHGDRRQPLRPRGRQDRQGAVRQGQGQGRAPSPSRSTSSAATSSTPNAKTQLRTDKEGIPAGWMGLDAGPKSRELYAEVIARAKTIIWNGPPGVFEFDAFAGGTKAMAAAIAKATAAGATTVVGGGDTATAAKKFKVADKVSHCSTGGGASLEFLEGKVLPGVAFLEKA